MYVTGYTICVWKQFASQEQILFLKGCKMNIPRLFYIHSSISTFFLRATVLLQFYYPSNANTVFHVFLKKVRVVRDIRSLK